MPKVILCAICGGSLVRASSGKDRGKIIFTTYVDRIGNEVKAHKTCAKNQGKSLTADLDHSATPIFGGEGGTFITKPKPHAP